jgi:hypothetical protein
VLATICIAAARQMVDRRDEVSRSPPADYPPEDCRYAAEVAPLATICIVAGRPLDG